MLHADEVRHALAAAIQVVDLGILWYTFVVNSFFALLLVLAAPQLFAHWRFGSEDVLTRSIYKHDDNDVDAACAALHKA